MVVPLTQLTRLDKRLSKMRKYELAALVKELLQTIDDINDKIVDDVNTNLATIETRLTAGGL